MPTYRVTYRPLRGRRRLLEDVEVDFLRAEPGYLVLVRDQVSILRAREVVALRVARWEVTAVLRLCVVSAWWGGVGCRHPPRPFKIGRELGSRPSAAGVRAGRMST